MVFWVSSCRTNFLLPHVSLIVGTKECSSFEDLPWLTLGLRNSVCGKKDCKMGNKNHSPQGRVNDFDSPNAGKLGLRSPRSDMTLMLHFWYNLSLFKKCLVERANYMPERQIGPSIFLVSLATRYEEYTWSDRELVLARWSMPGMEQKNMVEALNTMWKKNVWDR